LAVEYWRLSNWLEQSPCRQNAAPARHALRRIADFLQAQEIEVQALDGRPFDAGLAARVVDTIDDANLSEASSVIDQTLSPLVLWRGQVVKAAEVIVRRGAKA